ncbi:MBL fold metallo-hydrolase [Kiloniella laminariae]|uniref:MBL fold metallo-hydrolase n=1 Tax=Kiloniella laminariae TaxID=454162 RepID=UPI00036247EE|nr:ribonuclease Z [Kiloniella laminariae]
MEIDVLGAGEAFSPRDPNASVLIREEGFCLLIDCGPTVPQQLWSRDLSADAIDAIYITHLHSDHCAGLGPLANQLESRGRTKPLDIYCLPQGMERLKAAFDFGLWPRPEACPFPLRWHDIRNSGTIGPMQCRVAPTAHSVINHAIRLDAAGKSLFYSGDGAATTASLELMKGADLVFQESWADGPENLEPGHFDARSCLEIAAEMKIPSMRLYHIRDDLIDQVEALVAKTDNVRVARAGEIIIL